MFLRVPPDEGALLPSPRGGCVNLCPPALGSAHPAPKPLATLGGLSQYVPSSDAFGCKWDESLFLSDSFGLFVSHLLIFSLILSVAFC